MLRLVYFLFAAAWVLGAQTDSVRVWQDTVTLPSYKEAPPSPVPPFDQFAFGVPSLAVTAIYPYTFRLKMTGEKRDVAWRVLHLENQYLHCQVLPDLGGHLYTCRDKLSGADVFYANTTIKKSNIAPRGAWFASGIETSFPVAHSRVAVSPVQFATTTDGDGSATVFVGTADRVSGMEWRVAYTLHPGSAVLQQKTWLYNPGPVRQPYQWWSNASIRLPDRGVQFTFPTRVTAPHGAGVMESWPVDSHGVDRTRSVNYEDGLGLFAWGSREPFFGVYNPQSRTGVAHWAEPREVPGKKIWVWGNRDHAYQNNLSDDHSGYVEIQAGLMTTQDMMEFLEPQQSRSFSELWIPARDTGGISRATPDAVLYLQRMPQAGGAVKATIGLNVTRALPHATLTVTKSGATVLERTVDLDPATPFHGETESSEAGGKFRFELKEASGQVLLVHQEDTYDTVTPGEVKIGAPLPSAVGNSALARAEQDELARLLDRAEDDYAAAMKSSPKTPGVQKAAGRFYVELNRFADAAAILGPLQQENPGDAEIVYYLGIAKSELGDDAGARELWQPILADPRFGLAAQDRLACALARAGQQQAAVGMLHALAARGPGRAAGLEVALLRRMGQIDEALTAVKSYLSVNPMDSLLRVEAVRLGREDAGIWKQLAADPEWVLDVADEYLDAGLYQDAVDLLDHDYPAGEEEQMEPGAVRARDYPLVAYYRGYARLRLTQSPAEDFSRAAALSTLYVHPNRASSYKVLRAAVEQNPADGTAHYLLGCLLFNSRATDKALAEWDLAKPSGARIPAYYETVARVLIDVKRNERRAAAVVGEGLAAKPGDTGLLNLRASLRGVPVAVTGRGALPPSSFSSPAAAAEYAFTALAKRNQGDAESVFQAANFPQERQILDVRMAYIETRLQGLLAAAEQGICGDVPARIDNFAPEDPNLPFTFYGFRDLTTQSRVQFYFGLAESLCGNKKGAERRWRRIAGAKAPASSADFPFPVLAASLMDPSGSKRVTETALETLRVGSGPREKGLRLYVEGMLLLAAGRREEATARFQEGAAEGPAYVRYLNSSAQYAPALPR